MIAICIALGVLASLLVPYALMRSSHLKSAHNENTQNLIDWHTHLHECKKHCQPPKPPPNMTAVSGFCGLTATYDRKAVDAHIAQQARRQLWQILKRIE